MNRIGVAVVAAVVAVASVVGVATAHNGVARAAAIVTGVVAVLVLIFEATSHRHAVVPASALPTLHQVSNELFDAHGVDELGRAVGMAAPSLGASAAYLVVGEDEELVMLPRNNGSATSLGAMAAPIVPSLRPAEFVASRARPALWSASNLAARFPEWAGFLGLHGVLSVAMLPIAPDVRSPGALLLLYDARQAFGAEQRAFLDHVAGQVERAVEKAFVEEASRAIASELQQGLLGPTVLLPQVGHSSRYLPAEAELSVGGDWYQTIQLGDGNFGIAVGDALGHGVAAAAVMGQLRSALAACALRATSAADAVDVLDEYAASVPGAAATTVVYAVVDVVDGWLEYTSAGHPYPVYVSPEGEVRLLDDAQGLPLGSDTCSRVRPYARVPFPAGSTIVMYTDGLIERRRVSLADGFARLVATVEGHWMLPIELLADRLVDELLVDPVRRDDVAVLVLRSPVNSPDVFLAKMPARATELAPLRRDLRTWLAVHLDDPRDLSAVLTAVGEACANAIDHAYSDQHEPLMRVEAARVEREIVMTVTDTGRWKTPSVRPERGRGIAMMRGLVDDVVIERRASGTSVTLRYGMDRERP